MANEEAMRRVGANLKHARKNKGLTQEELASLIPGQSKPQISAYENGKRDVPRDKVERFAEVLGISPMSLIPLEEWSRPEEPELFVSPGRQILNEKEHPMKDRTYATPTEAARLLGTSAQMVRVSLRQRAPGWESLPFFMCGRNIKIPWDGLRAFAQGRAGATATAVCKKVKR